MKTYHVKVSRYKNFQPDDSTQFNDTRSTMFKVPHKEKKKEEKGETITFAFQTPSFT